MKWKSGDPALLVAPHGADFCNPPASGQHCVLLNFLGDMQSSFTGLIMLSTWRVRLDDGRIINASELALQKPPPYDGNELGSFEGIGWRPSVPVTVDV